MKKKKDSVNVKRNVNKQISKNIIDGEVFVDFEKSEKIRVCKSKS